MSTGTLSAITVMVVALRAVATDRTMQRRRRLVTSLIQARGYPTEKLGQPARHLSVEYGRTLLHYRQRPGLR
ncbi:hypothetical protein ACFVZW_07935 [Streptomyces sp. NPDC059567]|uniref:hypothetical protein n=1 Tax=Streptomyces sp. NPDC059567 TaxID=3346867 RepID=UPI00368F09ED